MDANLPAAESPETTTAPATTTAPKRTRPAPSKTFQCRGHGDCRMVFSRSEHLARHIRKHTGERPFTCHCGKQFSRLDNLRQHAQTVHADKPDMNERMMRDLGRVHATMVAANKQAASNGGGAGTSGRATRVSQDSSGGTSTVNDRGGRSAGRSRARPGTSTGYEGAGGSEVTDMYPGLTMPSNQLSLTSFSDLSDPYLIPKREKSHDDLATLALEGENGNGPYSRSENTNGSYSNYSNVRYQDPRQYNMDIDAQLTSSSRRQSFRTHHESRDVSEYGHSFRTFRDHRQQRPNSSYYPAHPQHSRSFSGGGNGPFRFNVPEGDGSSYPSERERERPSTATTARPGTSTRPSTGTTLPPLASVVPSSVAPLPPPPTSLARPGSNAGLGGRPISSAGLGGILNGYGNSLPPRGSSSASSASGGFPSLSALSGPGNSNGLRLPPPNSSGFDLRPGSRGGSSQGLGLWAHRPGTAPALGPRAGPSATGSSNYNGSSGVGMGIGWEDDRSSFGDSPFSFNAPPLSSSSSGNRKRGFSAVEEGDGDDEEGESRPQSRKLSIMELCEPGDTESTSGRPRTGGILFTAVGNMDRDRDVYSGTGSRPGTNGTGLIVRGAAGLDLGDRDNGSKSSASKSYELLNGTPHAAEGAASKIKGEVPGPSAPYSTISNSSSTKSASPGPPATTPSPLSAYATRPSTSGSYRSSRSPRSPIESDHHGQYGHYGRHASGSEYGQYGSSGYGSSNSSYTRQSSYTGRYASGGSPSSNISTSPTMTGARSPLSARSPSTAGEAHLWK